MKIQDVVFLVVLGVLVLIRNPKLAAAAGMVCLILSIPLFSLWVFFTAERLTWYAAGFFLLAIILIIIEQRKRLNK